MLHLPALAPGFDDPIALLIACHDKVRRFAALSLRLSAHVLERGADDEARRAASDILRYFTIAAPLHHADEEHDLFPALRALHDADLTASIDAIEAEHATLAVLWSAVREWLEQIADGTVATPPAELPLFAHEYPAHAGREEELLYGAASRLAHHQLHALGQRMSERRIQR